MSNKKQTDHIVEANKMVTAVEQLIEKLIAKSKENDPNNFTIQIYFESNKDLIEQAKAMGKEQIKNAFCDGNDHEPLEVPKDSSEQYYLETYEHTTK
jgi:hypothetical protein